MVPFPDWLSDRMRASGYDAETLAREVNRSAACVRHWLGGVHLPPTTCFAGLAEALQVDESELRRVVIASRPEGAAHCQPSTTAPGVRS